MLEFLETMTAWTAAFVASSMLIGPLVLELTIDSLQLSFEKLGIAGYHHRLDWATKYWVPPLAAFAVWTGLTVWGVGGTPLHLIILSFGFGALTGWFVVSWSAFRETKYFSHVTRWLEKFQWLKQFDANWVPIVIAVLFFAIAVLPWLKAFAFIFDDVFFTLLFAGAWSRFVKSPYWIIARKWFDLLVDAPCAALARSSR